MGYPDQFHSFWLSTMWSVEDVTMQPKMMTKIETVDKNKLYLQLVLTYLANQCGYIQRI